MNYEKFIYKYALLIFRKTGSHYLDEVLSQLENFHDLEFNSHKIKEIKNKVDDYIKKYDRPIYTVMPLNKDFKDLKIDSPFIFFKEYQGKTYFGTCDDLNMKNAKVVTETLLGTDFVKF